MHSIAWIHMLEYTVFEQVYSVLLQYTCLNTLCIQYCFNTLAWIHCIRASVLKQYCVLLTLYSSKCIQAILCIAWIHLLMHSIAWIHLLEYMDTLARPASRSPSNQSSELCAVAQHTSNSRSTVARCSSSQRYSLFCRALSQKRPIRKAIIKKSELCAVATYPSHKQSTVARCSSAQDVWSESLSSGVCLCTPLAHSCDMSLGMSWPPCTFRYVSHVPYLHTCLTWHAHSPDKSWPPCTFRYVRQGTGRRRHVWRDVSEGTGRPRRTFRDMSDMSLYLQTCHTCLTWQAHSSDMSHVSHNMLTLRTWLTWHAHSSHMYMSSDRHVRRHRHVRQNTSPVSQDNASLYLETCQTCLSADWHAHSSNMSQDILSSDMSWRYREASLFSSDKISYRTHAHRVC